MTSKEKALELVDKYNNQLQKDMTCIVYVENAKQCALICVDEILKLYKDNWNIANSYWNEVKQELLKL